MLTRRYFAQLVGAQLAAQSLRGDSVTPYPFVDGLCISPSLNPRSVDLFSNSGLSGVILDISQATSVVRSDGIQIYPRSYTETLKWAAAHARWLRDNSAVAFLATRGSEITKAFQDRRTAVFFQAQGCDWLEDDLDRLSVAYELGLRVLQITHNNDNPYGGAGTEKLWVGLSTKGQELVRRLNDLNIIPDVSHASHLTALDVIKVSSRPVVLTHGAARAIVNNARCAPDEVIRAVASKGGVMGIFMMSFWLTSDPVPTLEAVMRQIRHVIKVGGIDAVGIANDFPIDGDPATRGLGKDAVQGYMPWWSQYAKIGVLGFDKLPQHVAVPELNNVSRMYTIHAALEKSGFSSRDVEKIMGGNWVRFLTGCLG